MRYLINIFRFLVIVCLVCFKTFYTFSQEDPKPWKNLTGQNKRAYKKTQRILDNFINTNSFHNICGYQVFGKVYIDTILVDEADKQIDIHFSRIFSYMPFREARISYINNQIKDRLGFWFRKYKLNIYTMGQPIENLIPNFYRSDIQEYDSARFSKKKKETPQTIRNISKPYKPTKGLNERTIALWHSHGWYYEPTLDRWEWQRARAFQTVEDLFPMSFVIPYIVPMLENAGANVFLPRERDLQTNEVIIDNDVPDSISYIEKETGGSKWSTGAEKAYATGKRPYRENDNPFKQGTYRKIKASKKATASIQYIPDIPESGEYGVYIAYKHGEKNVSDAKYTVYHKGEKTEYEINQKIGGSTWVYLGKFKFDKGVNPETGRVELTNQSNETGSVTADAVRFGGGMGVIARNGQVSGRPRWTEAARYYMQFAGMPDSITYELNKNNDYTDDYQSRGEWVNYLMGAPNGPKYHRDVEGLGIPIDLSFAFHTDAGTTKDDKTIGTLGIYSTIPDNGWFPDGVSRLASRDFMDMMQTEIVNTARTHYDTEWNRRGLWNKEYSEAYRPNVPAALLELLSHQNFADMRYGHEPMFKFDISRAIYKSMLKFLSVQYHFNYVVQPLPITHFHLSFAGENRVKLKWKPKDDPDEPTAKAEKYIVYTRIGDNDFDNGVLVEKNEFVTEIKPNEIYSFKVTAVNEGGESFPSEILSACRNENNKKTVLIVNGFDRVDAPYSFDNGDNAGFVDYVDEGVPYLYDLNYIGSQYSYARNDEWRDDDDPGWGASFYNYETTVIPGNTFDFTFVHGQSIKEAGYSFISVSDEAVEDSMVNMADYEIMDLIYGEEKTSDIHKNMRGVKFQVFNNKLQKQIKTFTGRGGSIFITGAYIGLDLFKGKDKKHNDVTFGKETLGYFWRTNYASKSGNVYSIDKYFKDVFSDVKFSTDFNSKVYKVEAPDAIEPAGKNSKVILRYKDSNTSAGVSYSGKYKVVALGFPFETIIDKEHRNKVMKGVLEFLER